MHQSLPFSSPGSASHTLSRSSIWSELFNAMPIVVFILAIRQSWHEEQESTPGSG